jgi:hypothetical protein
MSEAESSSYNLRLKDHLVAYKSNVLGVARSGTWYQREYGHILPVDRRERNITEPYRDEFWNYWAEQEKQGKRLHQGFPHLNSSQGLCFNLFFPFLADGGQLISLLSAVLGLPNQTIERAEFEYHAPDGSYVDFFLSMKGKDVYFEVKLSETEFGAAPEDEEQIRKLDRIYAGRELRFTPAFCEQKSFFENYQILRTIWQMRLDYDDEVFFVYPKGNGQLREAKTVIRTCTRPPLSTRVHVLYLEDLLDSIERLRLNDRARAHYGQFRDKYII